MACPRPGEIAAHATNRVCNTAWQPRNARAAMRRGSLCSVLCIAALSACGRPAQDVSEYSLAEAASDVRDHLSYGLESDPADPFRAELHVTQDLMLAAAGGNIDQTWALKMAEHQKGSIRLAVILMRTNPPADVQVQARRVISRAQSNLRSMAAVRKGSFRTDAKSADAFTPAIQLMFRDARLAQGKKPSDTWQGKMVAYDRGAVKISGIAITRATDSRVRAVARQVASSLADEADQFEKADIAA